MKACLSLSPPPCPGLSLSGVGPAEGQDLGMWFPIRWWLVVAARVREGFFVRGMQWRVELLNNGLTWEVV